MIRALPWLVFVALASCATQEPSTSQPPQSDGTVDSQDTDGSSDTRLDVPSSSASSADVERVSVSGGPGAYSFSVTIKSPDTGCAQYADWWEVLTPQGELLYRRILAHSHVDEQPFARSGGPVDIQADQTVWVRAHMNTSGYGTQVMELTPDRAQDQRAITVPAGTAEGLAQQAPLPGTCAF